MITDWDDAYANRDHVPEAQPLIDAWPGDAARFRESLLQDGRATLDIPYGSGPRERLDLFLPQGTPKGLVVFIHGGYWIHFDKNSWSHFAAGSLSRGFAVAMPSYPVSPEARIPEISAAIGRAITHAAQMISGPIHIAGHSAGGHLAARMITDASPLSRDIRERIARCVPISGLFDLRPMLRLKMNEDWQLTRETAMAESPAMQYPDPHVHVTAWVGGIERPEFLRHTALLANIWTGCGGQIIKIVDPFTHHFDVIDGLKDPDHTLCKVVIGV